MSPKVLPDPVERESPGPEIGGIYLGVPFKEPEVQGIALLYYRREMGLPSPNSYPLTVPYLPFTKGRIKSLLDRTTMVVVFRLTRDVSQGRRTLEYRLFVS